MEDGQIMNPSRLDYKMPRAFEMPEVDHIIVESIDPNGPFGAKEVGEWAHRLYDAGDRQRGRERGRSAGQGDAVSAVAGAEKDQPGLTLSRYASSITATSSSFARSTILVSTCFRNGRGIPVSFLQASRVNCTSASIRLPT